MEAKPLALSALFGVAAGTATGLIAPVAALPLALTAIGIGIVVATMNPKALPLFSGISAGALLGSWLNVALLSGISSIAGQHQNYEMFLNPEDSSFEVPYTEPGGTIPGLPHLNF